VQKFTRPLTREIELAGERLALTFSAEGISIRPVGSRKPPQEVSWATFLCRVADQSDDEAVPAQEKVSGALNWLRSGKRSAEGTPTPTSPELKATLDRLEAWLAANRPRYHEALCPGAGEAELDALKAALGSPVPGDLRMLLTWHNGQRAEFAGAFEQSWNLMSARQIAEAKAELDADPVELAWRKEWVPILEDDAGDFVAVDPTLPGAPVREVWQGQAEHPVVAPSLAAWLERFVGEVEGGKYVEDPERGAFLRQR
jgi:cell wall assembly regulator SMI1